MLKIRKAVEADMPEICDLFSSYSGRAATYSIADVIKNFPAIVALSSEKIIAFCYSKSFAPDIIELSNMLVSEPFREQGIGANLLSAFEKEAFKQYEAIILVNSMLYKTKGTKIPAASFYIKNGYIESFSTPNSKILTKRK